MGIRSRAHLLSQRRINNFGMRHSACGMPHDSLTCTAHSAGKGCNRAFVGDFSALHRAAGFPDDQGGRQAHLNRGALWLLDSFD
jgi:hypothetical protein